MQQQHFKLHLEETTAKRCNKLFFQKSNLLFERLTLYAIMKMFFKEKNNALRFIEVTF